MNWVKGFLFSLGICFILSGCQKEEPNHTDSKQVVQPENVSPPTTNPSSTSQDPFLKEEKASYIHGLPGPLPDTPLHYTLTIDLTRGFAIHWASSDLAVFDQSTLNEHPTQIIDGEKSGQDLIFQSLLSPSIGHLYLFGLGDPPDYGMNTPIAIYGDHTKIDEVYFVMGQAMGGIRTITDMSGKQLVKGKEFSDINGFWYLLKTNVWYQVMESNPDPENNTQLAFTFKLQKVK